MSEVDKEKVSELMSVSVSVWLIAKHHNLGMHKIHGYIYRSVPFLFPNSSAHFGNLAFSCSHLFRQIGV